MLINNKLDIIIPVYKNKQLTQECIESLVLNLHEIHYYNIHINIINDSPDDADLSSYLSSLTEKYANNETFKMKIITNNYNIGFIKSVNIGLDLCKKRKSNAILINSDTVTFPGTLSNLLDAAMLDPQIGFACPRSNNASLATFPHFPHRMSGSVVSPEKAYSVWLRLKDHLPVITYTPTAVGFYLFIKDRVLYSFNKLDEEFGMGYEEENDLIMRANKVGFLAVLANKSFAFHAGSASFNLLYNSVTTEKENNLKIIINKHPEFLSLIREYENSPEYFAESQISSLFPDNNGKYDVIFDLRRIWRSHNGTSRISKLLIEIICKHCQNDFNFFALCPEDTFEFHGFDKINNLKRVNDISSNYAIAINLAQPFDLDQINTLEKLAPLNIYCMHDIIAYDCGYLRAENGFELDLLWRHIATYSDGLMFISEFSKNTFINRFKLSIDRNKSCEFFTHLHPTDPSEYNTFHNDTSRSNSHILVLGNHFKHKNSYETARILSSRFPSAKIVCFGQDFSFDGNLEIVKSGDLSIESVIDYFNFASVIIIPSFYEGFGIGVIESLGAGKAIIARNIPATAEILNTYPKLSGIFLYDTNDEMLELVQKFEGTTSYSVGGLSSEEWGSNFNNFLNRIILSKNIYNNFVYRREHSRFLNEHVQLRNLLTKMATESTSMLPDQTQNQKKSEDQYPRTSLIDIFSIQNDQDFIFELYQLILGRSPDSQGLNHYMNLLNESDGDRVKIFRDLFMSHEIKNKYPKLNNYSFKKSSFFSKIIN